MVVIRHHSISLMVMYAISLHLWWTRCILVDPSALGATGVSSIHKYIANINASPLLTASIIGTAAILALIGIWTQHIRIVMFLLPQQLLLMMSMSGAVDAMWLGQFADGTVRPHAFIEADQAYGVLAAFWHTVAITAHALRVDRRVDQAQ